MGAERAEGKQHLLYRSEEGRSVEPSVQVIHLRTGQQVSAHAIDQWLARHGAEVLSFDDVYAACVHLLQHYADVPDLAFVGGDWLDAADAKIVRYIRQTWPQTAIILYSTHVPPPPVEQLPRMRICASGGALTTLLTQSPTMLAERIAQGPEPGEAVVVRLTPPRAVPDEPRAAPVPSKNGTSKTEHHDEIRHSGASPLATPAPRALLSPEELQALLESEEEG